MLRVALLRVALLLARVWRRTWITLLRVALLLVALLRIALLLVALLRIALLRVALLLEALLTVAALHRRLACAAVVAWKSWLWGGEPLHSQRGYDPSPPSKV